MISSGAVLMNAKSAGSSWRSLNGSKFPRPGSSGVVNWICFLSLLLFTHMGKIGWSVTIRYEVRVTMGVVEMGSTRDFRG